MSESSRSVSLAARELAKVSYQFPRQAFPDREGKKAPKGYWSWDDWACKMPYRVALSKGAPLEGETVVVLQARSRWWFFRQDKVNVSLDNVDEVADEIDKIVGEANRYGSVFKNNAPPKGWKSVIFDAAPLQVKAGASSLTLIEWRGIRVGMVQRGGKVVAATRFEAPRDQDVIIVVCHRTDMPHGFCQFDNRIWINEALVYRSPIGVNAVSLEAAQHLGDEDERNKPITCRIRKGGNTMVVEVKQDDFEFVSGGQFIIQLLDAKDRKPAEGLIFDVDKK
jgi:hypothetical protein